MQNAQHLAAAAAACLAVTLIGHALCAAPLDSGRAEPRGRAVWLSGGQQGAPIGLFVLLDTRGVLDDAGLDRARLGAALGWSAGVASAGVAALAIGDVLTGRHENRRRGLLGTLYAHFRLSPAIMSTPDGNAGAGATFTVMF